MNTTLGNKTIAEFMGLAYCTKYHYEGWYKDSEFNYRLCDYDGLKYNSSWDWLMPVVIECFDRYGALHDVSVFNADNQQFLLNDALLETNIQSLYKAVVNYITWYNENKKE